MPEELGPEGYLGKGSLSSRAKDELSNLKGKHSWRNYEKGQLNKAWNMCGEDLDGSDERMCKIAVRRHLVFIEDGRYNDMLESVDRFFQPLDRDEKKKFAEQNPHIVEAAREHNKIQRRSKIDIKTDVSDQYRVD